MSSQPSAQANRHRCRPNPAHRWYFKYAQRPDEVTLIKCFDTVEEPGVARLKLRSEVSRPT